MDADEVVGLDGAVSELRGGNSRRRKVLHECGVDLRSSRGPDAERKIITVLFCNVVGSTDFEDRLDPEELDALLDRYFALSGRRIEEAGGSVEILSSICDVK